MASSMPVDAFLLPLCLEQDFFLAFIGFYKMRVLAKRDVCSSGPAEMPAFVLGCNIWFSDWQRSSAIVVVVVVAVAVVAAIVG